MKRKRRMINAEGLLASRYHSTIIAQSAPISLLSRLRGEYYKCPHCKFLIRKSKAEISGFNAEHSMRHVRCPRCGRKIAVITDGGPIREVLRGTASIAIGGTLAIILYPLLNIYAIQLGFFLSLYGTLKIIMRPSG